MKGLQEYLDKYGRHFSTKLAIDITHSRWKASKVSEDVQKRVYYNVTQSTLGDMIYLMNVFYSAHKSKGECIKDTLSIIGDFGYFDGKIFTDWLLDISIRGIEVDFSKYI